MKLFFLVLLGFCALHVNAQSNRIIGIWTTPLEDTKVEIYQKGSRFYGKIIWLTPNVDKNGKPLTDTENPDPGKCQQKLEGLGIISDLVYSDQKWKGNIYDPESGKTYSTLIRLVDENTLELTGYVGLPVFGRTEVWRRASDVGSSR